MDVFKPTVISTDHNGSTGRACAGLHITAAPQIGCDIASCTALTFCWECLHGGPE